MGTCRRATRTDCVRKGHVLVSLKVGQCGCYYDRSDSSGEAVLQAGTAELVHRSYGAEDVPPRRPRTRISYRGG